jgi:hypothetical protein
MQEKQANRKVSLLLVVGFAFIFEVSVGSRPIATKTF